MTSEPDDDKLRLVLILHLFLGEAEVENETSTIEITIDGPEMHLMKIVMKNPRKKGMKGQKAEGGTRGKEGDIKLPGVHPPGHQGKQTEDAPS